MVGGIGIDRYTCGVLDIYVYEHSSERVYIYALTVMVHRKVFGCVHTVSTV